MFSQSQTTIPMKHSFSILAYTICTILLLAHNACTNTETSSDILPENTKASSSTSKHYVDTAIAHKGHFAMEIISNGKLAPTKQAEIRFQISEKIQQITVRNGQHVRKGDTLARLNSKLQRLKLQQAENRLTRAIHERNDLLIAYKNRALDSSKINKEVRTFFDLKSGYSDALVELELVRITLKSTIITAPINGIIANLDIKPHNYSQPGKVFCSVVGSSKFIAVFSVLENEATKLRFGQSVHIQTFAEDTLKYKGNVSAINPIVDETGKIEVRAEIENKFGSLISGMNIKVIVNNYISNQVFFPREAIVIRSGKDVVFKYSNGRAMWENVKVLHENSKHCAVSGKISSGDTIIVSGNLNLDHNAKVKIH